MSVKRSANTYHFKSGLIAIVAALSLAVIGAQMSLASGLKGVSHQQSQVSSRDVSVTWSDDSGRGMLRARNVRLAEDGSDVKSLAPGGNLEVEETKGDITRSVRMDWGTDGKLKRTYTVGGQTREFDAETQQWLSKILNRYLPK